MATWESIKLMSGDGGGAFNVNSAHPFENPTPVTNVVEIVAMLLIPVAFIRTFGVMVRDETGLGAICSSRKPVRDWHRGGSRAKRHP